MRRAFRTLFLFFVCGELASCGPYIRGTNIAGATFPQTPQAIALAQNGYGGSGASITTSVSGALCWGQASCNVNPINNGGTTNALGLNAPYAFGAYVDFNDSLKLKLFLNDRGNNRILIFNQVPTLPTTPPDVVVGQPDFVSGLPNFNTTSTISAQGFNTNSHVTVCPNGLMFVADRGNNRVLGYNQVPTTNAVAADFVIGQTTMSGNGAGTSSTNLSSPSAVHCINNMLFVVEKTNHRILVFNPIPTTTNPTASFVIGAPDMNTNTGGVCSASTFNHPYEATSDGTNLYVSDGDNNRIVVYTPIPTATGASGSVVLGQANMGTGTGGGTGSCQINQGGSVAANSMKSPESSAIQGNWLAVGDNQNNRILFFSLPVSTNQSATYEIGQVPTPSTFNSSSYTVDVNHLQDNRGLVFAGSSIWGPDETGNRLMVYPLPFTP